MSRQTLQYVCSSLESNSVTRCKLTAYKYKLSTRWQTVSKHRCVIHCFLTNALFCLCVAETLTLSYSLIPSFSLSIYLLLSPPFPCITHSPLVVPPNSVISPLLCPLFLLQKHVLLKSRMQVIYFTSEPT